MHSGSEGRLGDRSRASPPNYLSIFHSRSSHSPLLPYVHEHHLSLHSIKELKIQAGTVSSPTRLSKLADTPTSSTTIMKLFSFLIPLTTLFTSASSVLVQYDPIYDDSVTLMDAVACSDGKYGLM